MKSFENDMVLTVSEDIEPSIYDSFSKMSSRSGLNFTIYFEKPSGYFASYEWAIPTALILYFLKPYSEAFLQELAKDNYNQLKSALSSLANKLFGKDKKLEYGILVASQSPNKSVSKYCLAFSIVVVVQEKRTIKFIFENNLSAQQFIDASETIITFLQNNSVSSLLKHIENNEQALFYDQLIMTYDPSDKVLVTLNPHRIPGQSA